MDVVASAVGLDQERIAGEVGEQAKFDLRIIGGQKNVAGLGDEGSANAASEFGADGNVLEIRIRGRQTSRRGSGLAERGVEAAGGRVDERGQSVDVGGLQLGELTVIENHAGDGMFFREAFKHIDGGGDGASLAVFEGLREIQLVEENIAELSG